MCSKQGHTTDFTDVVGSIEIDNKAVDEAPSGSMVGIKVKARVRDGDKVYRVVDDPESPSRPWYKFSDELLSFESTHIAEPRVGRVLSAEKGSACLQSGRQLIKPKHEIHKFNPSPG